MASSRRSKAQPRMVPSAPGTVVSAGVVGVMPEMRLTIHGTAGADLVDNDDAANPEGYDAALHDDVTLLGPGDDRYIWGPGTGHDAVDGGPGVDTIQLNRIAGPPGQGWTLELFAGSWRMQRGQIRLAPGARGIIRSGDRCSLTFVNIEWIIWQDPTPAPG